MLLPPRSTKSSKLHMMTTTSFLLIVILFMHHSTFGASAAIYHYLRSSTTTSTTPQHTNAQALLPSSNGKSFTRNNGNCQQLEDSLNNPAVNCSRRANDDDDDGINVRHHRQHRQRQLSVSDQLDILRLGFIPTASSSSSLAREEEKEGEDKKKDQILKSRDDYVRHIPRGGGAGEGGGDCMSDCDATAITTSCQRTQIQPRIHSSKQRQQQHHHHQQQHIQKLSVEDQLDRLRLGFVPTFSSSSKRGQDNSHIARFSRGGGGGSGGGGHVVVSTSATKSFQHQLSLPSTTFAFLAGYSNVLCYRKFQCYATMMTGNIMTMSMFLAEQKWMSALWRCSLIMCYLVGSFLVRAIELQCQTCTSSNGSDRSGATMVQQQQQQQQKHYKVIASIVAVIFTVTDKLLSSPSSSGEESTRNKIVVPILALGYGMVYTSANRACNATMTQLVTGHITKLGSSFSDYMFGRAGSSKSWSGKKKEEVTTSCSILASFVFGGVAGSRFLDFVGTKGFPHFLLLGFIYASMLAFVK